MRRALALFLAPLAAPVLAAPVNLTGNGFTIGSKSATFGRTRRADAIGLIGPVIGQPLKAGSHGDCGQGEVLDYAKFRGKFELSFVKGRLSGWTADAAGLKTSRGVTVGSTVKMLRRAYPDVEVDPGDEANGGLGPRFQREGGPHGWLSGTGSTAKVSGLFAGATCLAGI